MTNVGIVDLDSGVWAAGGTYSTVAARSLAGAVSSLPGRNRDVGVYFISGRDGVPGTRHIAQHAVTPLPLERAARALLGRNARNQAIRGERPLRRALRLPDAGDPFWLARNHDLDVIFPVVAMPRVRPRSSTRTLGWIPDFQHEHLPRHFSAPEIRSRRRTAAAMVRHCDSIVLSSQTVADDFRRFYPDHAYKARVLPFPSRFAFTPPRTSAADMVKTYHLPDRYVLCANQFWAHKNHSQLIEALGVLRRKGSAVHAVFTGLPLDQRSRSNEPTSELLQALARNDLREHSTVLGLVPAAHLDGLLRGAAAVVQPSQHEGWNTTVQDAKALGRPILCSDIPVLREQVPEAAFFGAPPAELADALAGVLAAGAVVGVPEAEAIAAERAFAARHGRTLLTFCQEVVD